ncbi:beta-1,6-N-acetylglucosaminyltransferase [Pedobacter aquatilis]|uniref:beta-1,6-N-acetylglucosaminyltransferase n=1 Tax=Pedobacter aquatilis TaxID=351343 RepID=UPI0025B39F94|nr:beta-1,6-N-acetylglucosaminyltransferase [Pedobacter aquatilis]MDN3585377.1 beta-1,6-N-acetylglucosaminyltransferase [Pedobacter aquatilis]
MRIAHLILTYTDPKQTERMIKSMEHKDFDFYIHVDKKFDINPHLFLKSISNVYFINNRVDVKWAGYNTVKATFECIKEIVNTGIKYDYINFLSGQDYPLKSADEIMLFFSKNIGKEFLSYRDIKNDWKEGLIRMEKYFLSNYSFKGKNTIENILNYIMPKRKMPYNLHPYGKSMFWMLSPETAMYVVNKVEQDKKLINFFSLCWASDEFVFQTILLNSNLKHKVVNNNYRYIDWSLGGANPKVLDETDFEKIKEADMLFTRKVNKDISGKLLDLIDAKLLTLLTLFTWVT